MLVSTHTKFEEFNKNLSEEKKIYDVIILLMIMIIPNYSNDHVRMKILK